MPVVTTIDGILAYHDSEESIWNAGLGLGTPVIVTYSFSSGAELGNFENSGYPNASYYEFTAAQEDSFRDAVEMFSEISGIVFVEIEGEAMINVARGQGTGYGGYAHYPSPRIDWGYSFFGTLVIDGTGDFEIGSRRFGTILHEIGHAVGLSHPHEGIYTLAASVDNATNTVMTYNGGARNALGLLDLEALDHLYGDSINTDGWVFNDTSTGFSIAGGDRSDTIVAVTQDTTIEGGRGGDLLHGRGYDDSLFGGYGHDRIYGNGGQDHLVGSFGDDRIYGGFDDDNLFGGRGNDRLSGGDGWDNLNGSYGHDRMYGGSGADQLNGSFGQDRIYGGDGADSVFGGRGDDYIQGGDGWDEIDGGYGHDRIGGGADSDIISGGAGFDRLYGGSGYDFLHGEVGNDLLNGGADSDYLYGGAGNDVLVGARGDDIGYGGTGDDRMGGGSGNDFLYGGENNDRMYGSSGNDYLEGGIGDDWLSGGTGDDFLYGGAGNDTIYSGTGVNYITTGAGDDRVAVTAGSTADMYVGDGADVIIIRTDPNLQTNVTIYDFDYGVDQIRLDGNSLQLTTVQGSGVAEYDIYSNLILIGSLTIEGYSYDQIDTDTFDFI